MFTSTDPIDPFQLQLDQAVEAARSQLQTLLGQEIADKNTGLTARDGAAHDKWSTYKLLVRERQVRDVAARIGELATEAQLMAINLNTYGEGAANDAQNVISAMADTGSSVKQLATAAEALTQAMAGCAGITQANDDGEAVNTKAVAAKRAVEALLEETDLLKSMTIAASIVSVKTRSAGIAQKLSELNDQVATVAADATTSLAAADSDFTTTLANRNATWTEYYAAVAPFEQAVASSTGMQAGLKLLDQTVNYSLAVVPSNTPEAAGFEVSAKPPATLPAKPLRKLPAQAEKTVAPAAPTLLPAKSHKPWFTAVQAVNATGFDYTDPSVHWTEGCVSGEAYSVKLYTDSAGDAIKYGSSYCIFMILEPARDPEKVKDCGKEDETGKEKEPTKKHPSAGSQKAQPKSPLLVSLPSLPVTAAYTFTETSKPTVIAPPGGGLPFVVSFPLGTIPAGLVPSYRLLILPSALWLESEQNEEYLMDRVSAADYITLQVPPAAESTENPIKRQHAIAHILERLLQDLQHLDVPLYEKTLGAIQNCGGTPKAFALAGEPGELAKEVEWLRPLWGWANPQGPATQTLFAYFSPAPAPAKLEGYSFGYYADMYGDVIDLSLDGYKAVVLASGGAIDDADLEAIAVLSATSDVFGTPPDAYEQPLASLPSKHAKLARHATSANPE